MASSTLPLTAIALYSPSTETQFFPAGQFTLTSVLTWVSKQCKSSLHRPSRQMVSKIDVSFCDTWQWLSRSKHQTVDGPAAITLHGEACTWPSPLLSTSALLSLLKRAILVSLFTPGHLTQLAKAIFFWGSSFAQGESLIHLSRSMLRSSNSGGQNANLGPIIPGPFCSPACGADPEPEGVVLRHSPHATPTNGDLQRRF